MPDTVRTPDEKARLKRRRLRLAGLGFLVLATGVLAALEAWPFNLQPPPAPRQEPSLWHLLLEDRLTLGFVRLGLVAASLYGIVSVLGLVSDRRWLQRFAGLTADDPETVEELKGEVDQLTQERDEALAQRDEYFEMLEEATADEGGGDGA